jgi:hypothetical protein
MANSFSHSIQFHCAPKDGNYLQSCLKNFVFRLNGLTGKVKSRALTAWECATRKDPMIGLVGGVGWFGTRIFGATGRL